MLKKTIVFTDFNGDAQVEEWYFNLGKADLAEMEMATPGGMATYLKKITDNQDAQDIIDTFKMFVAKSVGKRSEDGRRHIRGPQITDEFMQSGAYEEFFMQLVTDADFAAEFINGLLPREIMAQIQNVELPEPKEYTVAELQSMDEAEFYRIAGNDPKNWTKDQMLAAFQRKNRQAA